MPAWLAPLAISAGENILSKLFGGGKQTSTQELSPEQRQLFNMLMEQYQGGTPSWIGEAINPKFDALRNLTKKTMVGQGMGQSGNLISALMNVEGQRGRETGIQTGQYKQGLLSQLGGIVGGTGTQTGQVTAGWGDVLSNMGGDIGLLMALGLFDKKKGGNLGEGAVNPYWLQSLAR